MSTGTPFLRRLVEAKLIMEGNIEEPVLLEALPRLKDVVKQLKRDNNTTCARLKSERRSAG